MKIEEKNTFGFFFIIAILFFIIGFWLIDVFRKDSGILSGIAILAGIFFVIMGVVVFIELLKTFQAESYEIEIKDDYLFFNNEKFSLKDSKITVEFPEFGPLTRVTLRIENNNNVKVVFENLVFYNRELKELLNLVKPYLKHKEIVNKIQEKNETLRLLNNGFALKNREFYSNEIKKIETTLISINGTYFMDFKIVLKNGEIIDKRLKGGSKEYAKAIYIEQKHKGVSKIYCDESNNIWLYIILALIVIVAVIIYFDRSSWYLGVIVFIISYFYFGKRMDTSYQMKLCKKVKEIFENANKE